MCARCEELEEELAFVRSELAEEVGDAELDDLRHVLGLTPHQAKIVLTLYRAKGRPVSCLRIDEALPEMDGAERASKVLMVKISQIRKRLGKDFITNVWNVGYRLPAASLDIVARTLGDIRPELTASDLVELESLPPDRLRTLAAMIAGIVAHKDGDGGRMVALAYRRIADRLTGAPRVAA